MTSSARNLGSPAREPPAFPAWAASLAGILTGARYVLMVADAEHRITFINDYFAALSGYALPEVDGELANPLHFPNADPVTRDHLRAALRRGESLHCKYTLHARSGSLHHLALSIQPLPAAPGQPSGWLLIGHEITDELGLRKQFAAHADRLQLTLESARMGTWEVNKETGTVIVDDSWLQLAGLTPADRDRAGELWMSRIHPEDREMMLPRIENAISGVDDVKTSRYRVQRPDGSLIWVQDTSRITEVSPDGQPVRLVGVVADITPLKESAERAERSAERLWMATEAANLGVWDHDLLLGNYYWSDRMREIHGLTPEKESLQAYAALTHPEDRARVGEAIRIGRDSDRPFDLQFRIIRPDGEVRHMEVFARMQKTPDGRPCRAVGITRDITEQVQLTMERQQAQKLESVGRLAAGIAHEINTPLQYVSDNLRFVTDSLTSLTSAVGHLQAAGTEAEIRQAAERVRQDPDMASAATEVPQAIADALHGMERITGIVWAMNTFSHPGNERTPMDLNRAISSTITVARGEWKSVAEVETDLDPGLPAVPVVPSEFNQVVLNLLVNAAHAIADGQAAGGSNPGRIVVRTRSDGDHAEVTVSDNGCGMSSEILPRIFDPFFTTKPIGKGTGQGLALAHRFATGHAGTITAQSTPGQGTRFTLRLPLKSREQAG